MISGIISIVGAVSSGWIKRLTKGVIGGRAFSVIFMMLFSSPLRRTAL